MTPSRTLARPAVAPPADVDVAQAREEAAELVRWLLVVGACVLAIGTAVWSSMAARHIALQLDQTRTALESARIERDRLMVERAILREPGRLQRYADGMGLVAPVSVVDLRTPTEPVVPTAVEALAAPAGVAP